MLPAAENDDADTAVGNKTRPVYALLAAASRTGTFGRAGDGLFARSSIKSAASLSSARVARGVEVNVGVADRLMCVSGCNRTSDSSTEIVAPRLLLLNVRRCDSAVEPTEDCDKEDPW